MHFSGALAIVHDGGRLGLDSYGASETVRDLGVHRLWQSANPQPQIQLMWSLVNKHPPPSPPH